MRALRFHSHGAPLDVIRLDDAARPAPGRHQVRIAVRACGLNPADWALCEGLFSGDLPRGIGLEVSGTVDAIGAHVRDTRVGDLVFGPAPFLGATAGAADFAVLDRWFAIPDGLDDVAAAALPMAVETADYAITGVGVQSGQTLLVHGAGSTVGYAAVQMALHRGVRVIATAGPTYADALRDVGAQVTSYGDGMVERVRELAGGSVDLAIDTAPPSDVLAQLVQTVKAPEHVLTISNFADAERLGVRLQFRDDADVPRHDGVLTEYAALAAQGRFTIPVAGRFPLEDWRSATELSMSGRARGKLLLTLS